MIGAALRALAGVPERRAHPIQDMDWGAFWGAPATIPNLPAPSIGEAFALPAVFACIRVLSETVAGLPLLTYRERADGGHERATGHSLYRLLRRSPNPEMTAFEFEELLTAHCAAWGNAYAQIIMDNSGRVLELWPLRPDRMTVERKNGALLYTYTQQNGRPVTLTRYQVHHRRALVSDGLVGMSPLQTTMLAVSLGMATEEFGARFFAQGARPSFVLSHPGQLKDQAFKRLKDDWNSSTAGEAHKVKIIEEGMKVEQIGIPPEEAQFLQTRTFQAQEIARIFRMPPHKIGLLENATFSNIEHQAIEFVTDTIRPWVIRFEQALYRDLLGEREQQSLYFEYLVDGLLRGDTGTRYGAYAVARQWGWLSVNDIRRLENMPPVEGGDVYLQPMNMTPAGSDFEENARRMPDPATWVAPLVEDKAQRLARREAADLRRKGVAVLRTDGDFDAWAALFYADLSSAASQELAPIVTAAARATGRSETTLSNVVAGALWQRTQRSLAQVRLVVDECQGAGEAPADALERYADGIEAAGSQVLAGAVLAALAEVSGPSASSGTMKNDR